MNSDYHAAYQAIKQAREALENGDKKNTFKWSNRAAKFAPDLETPWLLMGASETDPQRQIRYIQQALLINPSSRQARKAMRWAIQQLRLDEQPMNISPPDFNTENLLAQDIPIEEENKTIDHFIINPQNNISTSQAILIGLFALFIFIILCALVFVPFL